MAEWIRVPGTLKQVAVGSIAHIWGVQSGGEMWRFVGSETWQRVHGTASQVATCSDGTTCFVHRTGNVFLWDGEGWTKIASNMKEVAVGSAGNIWTVNSVGSVYRRVAGQFQQVDDAILSNISVAADGAVWGANAQGGVFRYNAATNKFERIGGTLKQVAAGSATAVWGVQTGGEVWRYNATGSIPFERVPGTLQQISVGADGVVWGVESNGHIYRYLAEAPVAISDFRMTEKHFQPGEDGDFAFRISNTAFGTTLSNIRLQLLYDTALFTDRKLTPANPTIDEPLPYGISRDVKFKITAGKDTPVGKYAMHGVKVSATVTFDPGLAPLASPVGGWMPFEVKAD